MGGLGKEASRRELGAWVGSGARNSGDPCEAHSDLEFLGCVCMCVCAHVCV